MVAMVFNINIIIIITFVILIPFVSRLSSSASFQEGEGAASPAAYYSPWSEWSSCSKARCKQTRQRHCTAEWRCGDAVITEERSCRACSSAPRRRRPFKVVVDSAKQRQDQDGDGEGRGVRRAQHNTIYEPWSQWTECSASCQTNRFRLCSAPLVCGTSVIQEQAFCYVRGSVCERIFRRRRKNTATKQNNGEQKANGAASGKDPAEDWASGSALPEDCGVANASSTDMALKIIGGKLTVRGKWPWQVAVLNRQKEAFCGGTLIAPRWVLTAAHCVRKRLYVRVGDYDLAKREGSEQELSVSRSFEHPRYDVEIVDNDVALLKLNATVRMGRHVKPACLPRQGSQLPPPSTMCIILGWGKLSHAAAHGTHTLREASVPLADAKDCLAAYKNYYQITDNMLCAGFKRASSSSSEGKRRGRNRRKDPKDSRDRESPDSCSGDSGGPLLCERDRRWHVYGVTSFGDGCGRKGKFGIYAKVPNYVSWIEKTLAEHNDQ